MEQLDILREMRHIDGITIIDNEGTIRFTVKFNPSFYPDKQFEEDIVGKKLCEVFTSIDESTSTLYQAMRGRRGVACRRQKIQNAGGATIETMNISLPIVVGDRVLGAVELSKDITDRNVKARQIIEIDRDIFNHQVAPDIRLGSNKARFTLDNLITDSPAMLALKERVVAGYNVSAPCFIYGETGTGKELLAHSLHTSSNRKDKPFISQNCAAIPENLLESILFGTVKGSYSGAVDAAGLFELADGGTLFFDEINSMSVGLQAKLLRVLEDGYIRRVGGSTEKRFDVRVICASNEDPTQLLAEGRLRRDIYYRLCVLYFYIPPLRERPEDVRLLLDYFISKYNHQFGRRVESVSKEVYKFFTTYDWPGNVRELEHFIQFGLAHAEENDGVLEMRHIAQRIPSSLAFPEGQRRGDFSQPLARHVEALERELMARAILKTGGNVSKAARLLGIPRQTLSRKLKTYRIPY